MPRFEISNKMLSVSSSVSSGCKIHIKKESYLEVFFWFSLRVLMGGPTKLLQLELVDNLDSQGI